jgi:hypothetical protein
MSEAAVVGISGGRSEDEADGPAEGGAASDLSAVEPCAAAEYTAPEEPAMSVRGSM